MQGVKIAIGGKGGVGKTTVCAIWAQLFAENGFDVLAIDADPNTNLALAFGIASEQSPEPLIRMKQLIAERTGTDKDAVGAYFRLNPKVSDLPEKYWFETNGLKLLVLGAITEAGAGCACPEGAFLKALLRHTILQRREIVFVDLAAGVEFMGRASIQGIDALVVVVEPGSRSIETAKNIVKMARELGIGYIGAIANKITDSSQIDVIKAQLKGDPISRKYGEMGTQEVDLLGSIYYSQSLQDADLQHAPAYGADAAVLDQLKESKQLLIDHIRGTS